MARVEEGKMGTQSETRQMRASRRRPPKTMRVVRVVRVMRVGWNGDRDGDKDKSWVEDRPWPSSFFREIMASWAAVVGSCRWQGEAVKTHDAVLGCRRGCCPIRRDVWKAKCGGRYGGVCAPLWQELVGSANDKRQEHSRRTCTCRLRKEHFANKGKNDLGCSWMH